MENVKRKPVRTVEIGSVVASIWRHDGEPLYTVTFRCLYEKGGGVRRTPTFTQRDLLFLPDVTAEVEAQLALLKWQGKRAA
jgi:hypothetical protein